MNGKGMNLQVKNLLTGFLVTMAAALLLAGCGGGGEESTEPESAWTTPVTLSQLDDDADGPRLAADGNGNTAVLWSQYDDTQATPGYRVWLNYWRAGTGWLGSTGIDSGNRRNPVFTVGADGSNRAAWSTAAADQLLYTQFRVDSGSSGPGGYGASWSHPRMLFVSGTGLGNVQVLTYGSNQTLMIYTVKGSPTVVKASIGAGGEAAGSTVQLSGATAASLPQLLRLPNNNALAAWCENGLLTSRRFDGTSWTAAAQASGCVDKNLLLAASADGTKVVAAGQKNYKGELHVWRYDTVNNAWSDTGDGSLPYPHESNYRPALAIDNAGRVLLAWADFDSNTNRRSLWASVGTRSYVLGVLTPINSWSEPVRLDNAALGDIAYPQLAMDTQGNAYAVWTQHDINGWDLYARHFKADSAAWGGIEALDTANDDAYKPQIVFDSKDKAIVAWGFVKGRYDDTVSGIRATRHK